MLGNQNNTSSRISLRLKSTHIHVVYAEKGLEAYTTDYVLFYVLHTFVYGLCFIWGVYMLHSMGSSFYICTLYS